MPQTWPARDPDAVKDYTFTIPLDAGDSVTAHTFDKIAGAAVVDDEEIDGATITAWLSGGVDGETSVYRVTWETADGRDDEDFITQMVVSNDYVELLLTDYQKPLPQHLIARYPDFAAVPVGTIQYWLTDAERFVDESWAEGDYAAGLMAMAAHNMALAGLGTEAAATSDLPGGVNSFKSGSLAVTFTDKAANERISGALGSTRYGAEYAALLRRNKTGPRVTATGAIPSSPQRFVDGGA